MNRVPSLRALIRLLNWRGPSKATGRSWGQVRLRSCPQEERCARPRRRLECHGLKFLHLWPGVAIERLRWRQDASTLAESPLSRRVQQPPSWRMLVAVPRISHAVSSPSYATLR